MTAHLREPAAAAARASVAWTEDRDVVDHVPTIRARLRCTDEGCTCVEAHLDITDAIPCCPRDGTPLEPSRKQDPRGYCPTCASRPHGIEAHYPPRAWRWRAREVFAGDDVPPWNGYTPLTPGATRAVAITVAPDAAEDAATALRMAGVTVVEVTALVEPEDVDTGQRGAGDFTDFGGEA